MTKKALLLFVILVSYYSFAQIVFDSGSQTGNILVSSIKIKVQPIPGDFIIPILTLGGIAGQANNVSCVDVNNNIPLTACGVALNNSKPEVDLYGFEGISTATTTLLKCSWDRPMSAIILQEGQYHGASQVVCGAGQTGKSSLGFVFIDNPDPDEVIVGAISAVNQSTTLIRGTQRLQRPANPQTVYADDTVGADGFLELQGIFPTAQYAALGIGLLP